MMKKLIIVVPTQLQENGTLIIKNSRSLQLMVAFLSDLYDITLLVRIYADKTVADISNLRVRLVYVSSSPNHMVDMSSYLSRFQASFYRWGDRERVSVRDGCQKDGTLCGEYDCLIAWDGCSPWCLATALTQVVANRKILWIQNDPQRYLIDVDHVFYARVCTSFDAVVASEEEIRSKVNSICATMGHGDCCTVIKSPIDASLYWKQSQQPIDCDFQTNELNILAISGMCKESSLEKLPGWLSEHMNQFQTLHCWLIGEGQRFDRYIQQIAIYAVDSIFTLLGKVNNPYPYIRMCDVLVVSKIDHQRDLEIAAELFRVPVIYFEELEQHLPEILKKEKQNASHVSIWQDQEKLINILEAEGKM